MVRKRARAGNNYHRWTKVDIYCILSGSIALRGVDQAIRRPPMRSADRSVGVDIGSDARLRISRIRFETIVRGDQPVEAINRTRTEISTIGSRQIVEHVSVVLHVFNVTASPLDAFGSKKLRSRTFELENCCSVPMVPCHYLTAPICLS